MFTVAGIGFTAPWLLTALAGLPVLWFLLRAVPPAPVHRRFPGVALLLGLADDETQTDRTPWWLLLLRLLAVALLIIGFSGPVLNPRDDSLPTGPLLIAIDGTWADAPDWNRRIEHIDAVLADATRTARPVALVRLTDLPADGLSFQTADVVASRLPNLQPNPWEPDPSALNRWIGILQEGGFDTLWVSDGLYRESRTELLQVLEERGTVTVFESARSVLALRPVVFGPEGITVAATRSSTSGAAGVTVTAIGLDPSGVERHLAAVELSFVGSEQEAEAVLSLPAELRNRISRFEIANVRSAGAVVLTDDALKRREVALVEDSGRHEGPELMSPFHYLDRALRPTVDLIGGALSDMLLANPDIIVLADIARISDAEKQPLLEWIERGGLLLRFAGPRLAASDVSREEQDPLMPVRLRAGGRTIGGAMSWGEAKALRAFTANSPFFGLSVPEDVRVSSQVLAQPDPDLSESVIASLADGTPLVTRKRIGQGQVVLFHVTANAEWSTLPLSGLFVQMLERLAVSARSSDPSPEALAGTVWSADGILDAFGVGSGASNLAGVPGERIAEALPGPDMPPGLYALEEQRIAVNVADSLAELSPSVWPAHIPILGLETLQETVLKGWFLAAAVMLLMLDVLGSLWLTGRLVPTSRGAATAGLVVLLCSGMQAEAQSSDEMLLKATSEVTLAYVVTGDQTNDFVAEAGLRGLSNVLRERTSVEPGEPVAVNFETDELSVFPFLYWAVSPSQELPTASAYAKLNRFLRGGGMIMFDTLDANISSFGQLSAFGRKLRQITQQLDIPPLEPLPADHVLTRSFYLLQSFPGRYAGQDVWVEAAVDAELIEGMPFRNLNDSVTPVLIGGNDWAAAWAVDEDGNDMFRVGRGSAGERQRELARRFGVNVIMHVLTGNYKSDQVHVPALLERLGQ